MPRGARHGVVRRRQARPQTELVEGLLEKDLKATDTVPCRILLDEREQRRLFGAVRHVNRHAAAGRQQVGRQHNVGAARRQRRAGSRHIAHNDVGRLGSGVRERLQRLHAPLGRHARRKLRGLRVRAVVQEDGRGAQPVHCIQCGARRATGADHEGRARCAAGPVRQLIDRTPVRVLAVQRQALAVALWHHRVDCANGLRLRRQRVQQCQDVALVGDRDTRTAKVGRAHERTYARIDLGRLVQRVRVRQAQQLKRSIVDERAQRVHDRRAQEGKALRRQQAEEVARRVDLLHA